ncbi:fructosamine kinase family protein [Cesiribacter andamanensis]|uniref:Fructosamine-3-kinase n=1 Tax=Cesiribacter andamanensis AMV16 TaxID=1279009 RepID=M7N8P1_9BACT|nr:fructosamine kinase family protein [Cesiribacter andamanensis]EMR03581.1 Fructosamine-3-kinase [Cesiribacter andamanensis AMV16]
MFEDRMPFFEQVLFKSLGRHLTIDDMQVKGGGCINQTVYLKAGTGKYFLKWNEGADEGLFAAEARGLALLKAAAALPVPEVLGQDTAVGKPYLLLEYLDSRPPRTDYWSALGRGLAALHGHSQDLWGLDHANFIGRLPQSNNPMDAWVDFFIERRLEPQLGLAFYQQQIDRAFMTHFRTLYPRLRELLVADRPALLHGDLWSGNVMPGPDGRAWIFDPAVYYGHREAELAFTTLFGGFEEGFYAAYTEARPLEPGYQERYDLYNLYPLLVHVNLFGASYLSGVQRILRRFL